jgi:DNA-binding transcriptional MerR regulator
MAAMSNKLLSIGAFARLSRLSVKRLRHYDELGLLEPASVDERSGYRYYTPEQARSGLIVSMLRSLDVSLPVIERVISGDPSEGVMALAEERRRLAADVERRRAALHAIERILEHGPTAHDVAVATDRERKVRVVRASAAATDVAATVERLIAGLVSELAASDATWRPPIVGLYPLEIDERLDVAVCVELVASTPAVDAETLPAVVGATIRHVGPYTELPLAYHTLFAWVADRGHDPCGPVRELYLTDPSGAEPEALVTELILPIKPPIEGGQRARDPDD